MQPGDPTWRPTTVKPIGVTYGDGPSSASRRSSVLSCSRRPCRPWISSIRLMASSRRRPAVAPGWSIAKERRRLSISYLRSTTGVYEQVFDDARGEADEPRAFAAALFPRPASIDAALGERCFNLSPPTHDAANTTHYRHSRESNTWAHRRNQGGSLWV
jgi:hypothetical protein